MNQSAILTLAEYLVKKQPAVLAIVIETQGSSPVKVGAQMVYLADGHTIGTVGGGKLEAAVLKDAGLVLEHGQPRTTHYRLAESGEDAIGTLCGGEVQVFLHPYLPLPQLVIVGGGHIGKPLATMAEAAGFDVTVVDVEPGRADMAGLEAIAFTHDSYVVLITTDHISDEAALRLAIATPARYIGMIGSRAKCRTILEHLRRDAFTEGQISRVYAPIGLNLGGPTPQEIAVSILAEIISVRRGGSGVKRCAGRWTCWYKTSGYLACCCLLINVNSG